MAVRHFSSILNNSLPRDDLTPFTHENAFPPQFYESVYFVKPKRAEYIEVTFTWCVPPQSSVNRSVQITWLAVFKLVYSYSEQAYGFLLRTICPNHLVLGLNGSLGTYLEQKRWSEGLNVDLYNNDAFSLFLIKVYPTDSGWNSLDEVIETVFSYIRVHLPMLKRDGLIERLYRDFVNVESWPQRGSNYTLHTSVMCSATQLAESLVAHSPSRQLKSECDLGAIHDAIDTLNGGKFNITITVPVGYDKSVQFELKDESCGAEYSVRKMPPKWISLWANPRAFDGLSLPAPNPMISKSCTMARKRFTNTRPKCTRVMWANCGFAKTTNICYLPPTAISIWRHRSYCPRRRSKRFLHSLCFRHHTFIDSIYFHASSAMNTLLFHILENRRKTLSKEIQGALVEYSFEEADDGIVLKVSRHMVRLHILIWWVMHIVAAAMGSESKHPFDCEIYYDRIEGNRRKYERRGISFLSESIRCYILKMWRSR